MILVLVVGVAWKAKDKLGPIKEVAKLELKQKKADVKQSLKELLGSGQSQKCTWRWDDESGSHSGTMYMMGKKFKQEIVSKLTGQGSEMKIITASDGENVYMWNEQMGDKGIKMPITNAESKDYSTANGKVAWDDKYEYECQAASVGESELSLPKQVTFEDLGVQLEDLKKLQDKFGNN